MVNLYYRDSVAAIICYDVTNEKSFQQTSYWLEEMKKQGTEDEIVLALAGNKCDSDPIHRKVPTHIAKDMGNQNGMLF